MVAVRIRTSPRPRSLTISARDSSTDERDRSALKDFSKDRQTSKVAQVCPRNMNSSRPARSRFSEMVFSRIKMGRERLVDLRCVHFAAKQFDLCSTQLGRDCQDYIQLIVGEDKGRSCMACKDVVMSRLGRASCYLRGLK